MTDQRKHLPGSKLFKSIADWLHKLIRSFQNVLVPYDFQETKDL